MYGLDAITRADSIQRTPSRKTDVSKGVCVVKRQANDHLVWDTSMGTRLKLFMVRCHSGPHGRVLNILHWLNLQKQNKKINLDYNLQSTHWECIKYIKVGQIEWHMWKKKQTVFTEKCQSSNSESENTQVGPETGANGKWHTNWICLLAVNRQQWRCLTRQMLLPKWTAKARQPSKVCTTIWILSTGHLRLKVNVFAHSN